MAPEAMRADLAPLQALAKRERHRRARAAMEQALTSERARTLHAEWAEILEVLVLESESDARPDAARPISDVAAGDPQGPPQDGEDGRGRSRRTRRRSNTTSCARRARSSATCWSCSRCRCSTLMLSSR